MRATRCVSLTIGAALILAVGPGRTDVTSLRTKLLQYLADLPNHPDQRVLSGQQVGDSVDPTWEDSATNGYPQYVDALAAATGERVALVGGWYVDWGTTLPTTANMLTLNAIMKKHWNTGGLVTLMFGPQNPWTHGGIDDTDLQGHTLTDAVTAGTAANAYLRSELDNVAVALADLQAAGIVVLWRPWHEFNGGWFWWGRAANGQDFINLWRYSHDYLTNTKQLHNLLWVFAAAPVAGSWIQPIDSHYPGDAYVDVVGLDVYGDTLDQYAVAGYNTLLAHGKPIALAEFGPDNATALTGSYDYSRLMPQVRALMPKLSYIMCWSDGVSDNNTDEYWSLISNRNANQFLSDAWVVNIDGLPPRVTSLTPAANATGVSAQNPALKVTFSTGMNHTTAQGAFALSPKQSAGATPPGWPGKFTWSGKTMIYTLSTALAPSTRYTVTIAPTATSDHGVAMLVRATSSFTTSNAPAVSSVSPASNATGVVISSLVKTTFNQAMNHNATLSAFKVVKAGTTTPLAGMVTWSGNTMQFRPAALLLASTKYTATVSRAARGSNGVAMLKAYSWSFTTGTSASPSQPTTVTATVAPTAQGAEIVVYLTTAATVRVSVLNMAGREVAVLPEQSLPAGSNTLQWNGRSTTGTMAPAGTYLVRITARSEAGSSCSALCSLRR